MNQEGFYLHILRMFQEEYHQAADRIASHIQHHDFPQARMIAHSIKSAAKTIGADELSTRAFVLELLLAESTTKPSALARFEEELQRIMDSLSHLPEKKVVKQASDGSLPEGFDHALDTLEKHLMNHDVEAESILESLDQLPVSAKIHSYITDLIALVEDIEYESALSLLRELREIVGGDDDE